MEGVLRSCPRSMLPAGVCVMIGFLYVAPAWLCEANRDKSA